MGAPVASSPWREMGTWSPNLLVCAARQAVITCCSSSVAGAPPAQPGVSPRLPFHVYVVLVTGLVQVSCVPAAAAHVTTYRMTMSDSSTCWLNQAMNALLFRLPTLKPLVPRPLVPRPLVP